MSEKYKITKDITAREDPKYVISHLIMSVAADLANKDKHDPAMWPEWSEESKAWWDEIEQRMTRPACLNFDWEAAKKEIREAVENEENRINRNRDYMTSWCVGMKDGLWKAYNIMEKYVKVKG